MTITTSATGKTNGSGKKKVKTMDSSLELLESSALRALCTSLRCMQVKLSKLLVDARLQRCAQELAKVSGGKYLHSSIRNITAQHIREGEKELAVATQCMNGVISKTKEYLNRVLHSNPNEVLIRKAASFTPRPALPSSWLLLPATSLFEVNRLKEGIADEAREQVASMVLEATHNPYMRHHSFPPLHININYLLDPGDIATSREFDPLYDVHKPGPTERRANPLRVPGVALSRFHPRDGDDMVSRESREAPGESWWQAVKAFFTED